MLRPEKLSPESYSNYHKTPWAFLRYCITSSRLHILSLKQQKETSLKFYEIIKDCNWTGHMQSYICHHKGVHFPISSKWYLLIKINITHMFVCDPSGSQLSLTHRTVAILHQTWLISFSVSERRFCATKAAGFMITSSKLLRRLLLLRLPSPALFKDPLESSFEALRIFNLLTRGVRLVESGFGLRL